VNASEPWKTEKENDEMTISMKEHCWQWWRTVIATTTPMTTTTISEKQQ